MMGGKSKHGEPLEFLRQHSAFVGDECLTWPYGRYTNGYGSVRFGRRALPAHRVMCLIAHGPPEGTRTDAAHSCGNGHLGCVNPRHLSWKSRAGNLVDRRAHGTMPAGERHGSAKLTAEQVKDIRALYAQGGLSHRAIGDRFGVNPTAVGKIVRGEKWAHVQ